MRSPCRRPRLGGNDCQQDVGPPTSLAATQNPYELSALSSELGIGSVRWANATAGESGVGTVTQVQACVPFIGCETWSRFVVVIPVTGACDASVRSYSKRRSFHHG